MPVSTTRCERSPSTNPTLGTSGTPPSGITQTPAAISTGSLRTSGTGGIWISVIGRETKYAARVTEPRVAIVGAGIGGLTPAIAPPPQGGGGGGGPPSPGGGGGGGAPPARGH